MDFSLPFVGEGKISPFPTKKQKDMRPRFNNLPEQKKYRKALRKNMTPCEGILWSKLRRGASGVKFRRQHSLGKYIADFYCAEKKLVIELDGSQHGEQVEYDTRRTHYFESLGIRVYRIWNGEIKTNLSGVLIAIQLILEGKKQVI